MRGFLGVSIAPHAADELRRPVPQALACLCDDDTAVERIEQHHDGWIAFAGSDEHDLLAEPGAGFTARLSRAARTRMSDVSTADVAAMISGDGDLAALVPPFAAAHRHGPGAPVVVVGDWLGFRQIYWWCGNGVAAVSTSARALSVLAGDGLDLAGLAAQALIGWQVGDATIFRGVRALPPATIATLAGGTLHQRRYAGPPVRPVQAIDLDDAVEEMAAILGDWQTSYLEEHPDAVLQLTGGHDSRILLAAIPEKLRAGLHALTLDDGRSADVAIAARLSARYGLRHQVHKPRWPTPEQAHNLVLTAARALECLASPLALAPLLLAEADLDQGHRLSGLGGEVARGFYYAGQPTGATTTAALVERLARWRLFSNEAVAAEALDPDFLADARDTTLTTLKELFAPGEWLRATDEFYLFHRMHRWAGAHGTVAAVRRHFINPMFDRRFIELALAVAPADKRDSLLLGRLVTRLDPDLARLPLDSGLTPARLATRSVVTHLTTRTLTVRQAAGKVRQRLTRARKAQLGAADASALVLAHWRAEPQACQALYDVPVLRRDWLDGLLAGRRSAEPTTVAFLVNLLARSSRDGPAVKELHLGQT